MKETYNSIFRSDEARRKAILDLCAVAAFCLTAYGLALVFDAFDKLVVFVAEHEEFELDELLFIPLLGSLALGIYSLRRWRDLADELARRTMLEKDLFNANAALKRRNKQLDELNFLLSHHLQEPLRHLMIFSRRVQPRIPQSAPDAVHKDLAAIENAAHRMRQTILSVQEVTSIQHRQPHLHVVSLHQCTDRAVRSLENEIGAAQAVVQIDELPKLACDEDLMAKLFRHLITNAIQYAGPQPRISISAIQQGKACTICVADNGTGIESGQEKKIFRPFERNVRLSQGSGMGLAICRAIVHHHHGEIWVQNLPQGGAEFQFTLSAGTIKPETPSRQKQPQRSKQSSHSVATAAR